MLREAAEGEYAKNEDNDEDDYDESNYVNQDSRGAMGWRGVGTNMSGWVVVVVGGDEMDVCASCSRSVVAVADV